MSADKNKKEEEESSSDEEEEETKKGGLGLRMKKNIAGRVMSSTMGKKIIPQEVRALLKSLNHIVTRVEGAKKAKEIENNIIKLIVKAKICIDEKKKVQEEEFLKADVPLRRSFNLIVDLYDFFGEPINDRTRNKFEQATSLMVDVSVILRDLYKPHVQPKTLGRLKSIFDVLSNPEFYLSVWKHPDISSDLDDLVDAMNKYIQFNF